MTSTSTSQGYSLQRNSSKVIQPPGGRTADIFGRSLQDETSGSSKTNAQPTHQQSSAPYADEIPVTSNPAAQAAAAAASEPQAEPLVTADDFKPVQQSELEPRGQEAAAPANQGAGGHGAHEGGQTSKKHFQQQRRNPITGEIITDQPAAPAVVRVRQPPGGRSSGIF